MKLFQEGPHGRDLGKGVTQAAGEKRIGVQQGNILRTIAAHSVQQKNRLSHLSLSQAALPLLELQIGLDQLRDFQRTVNPRDRQRTRVGRGGLAQGTRVQDETRLGKNGQPSRAGMAYAIAYL
jgi:hypothetical protein